MQAIKCVVVGDGAIGIYTVISASFNIENILI